MISWAIDLRDNQNEKHLQTTNFGVPASVFWGCKAIGYNALNPIGKVYAATGFTERKPLHTCFPSQEKRTKGHLLSVSYWKDGKRWNDGKEIMSPAYLIHTFSVCKKMTKKAPPSPILARNFTYHIPHTLDDESPRANLPEAQHHQCWSQTPPRATKFGVSLEVQPLHFYRLVSEPPLF